MEAPIGAIGRDWEELFAKLTGADLQPNSGATPFAKLDAGVAKILWSLKATGNKSYPITGEELDEAYIGARGIGGPGWTPAMGIKLGNGRMIVAMDLDEFMAVLAAPNEHLMQESKAKQRRRAAHRSDEDE